jgi:hypothetical protein
VGGVGLLVRVPGVPGVRCRRSRTRAGRGGDGPHRGRADLTAHASQFTGDTSFNTCTGEHSIERCSELAGPVANQEPEVINSVAERTVELGQSVVQSASTGVGGWAGKS